MIVSTIIIITIVIIYDWRADFRVSATSTVLARSGSFRGVLTI